METDNGYVYVIKVLNYYKIGKTINPKVRFYEYSRLMEFPKIIYCTFVKSFSKIETQLHELFKEKCSRGEWFFLDNNDLKIIYDILEQNKIYNDTVLSLEEIIKIHKKRENYINNLNNNQYKKKNNKFKIKNKQETNKVINKRLSKKEVKSLKIKEERINKCNEIKNKISIGHVYTYKELCELLGYDPKIGTNSKKSQFNEWKMYFKWSNPTTQKFIIEEIYDAPKDKIDGRKNNGGVREGAGKKKEIRENEYE